MADPIPCPTVAAMMAPFLDRVRVTRRRSTLGAYERNLRLHVLPHLGDVLLRDLDRPRIRRTAALARGVLGPTSARNVLTSLSALCAFAVDEGHIPRNPVSGAGTGLFRDNRVKLRRALTLVELTTLLAAIERVSPDKAIYYLTLARTGLRPGEGLALEWPDLDLDTRRARVAKTWTRFGFAPCKTGQERTIDLSQQLCDALRERRGARPADRFVFESSRGGRPFSNSRLEQVMKLGLAAARLPMHHRLHDFRHTFATLLLDGGWPIKFVQRALGHARIGMTADLYGRTALGSLHAAVDSLDDLLPGAARGPVLRVLKGGRHAVTPPGRTQPRV